MKRSVCYAIAACYFMLTTGCNQQSSSPSGPEAIVTVNPECGKFAISHLAGLNKAARTASIKDGANVNFDLGSIKGSTGFFFLLYNIGATPITDVSLKIENPALSVFPSNMDTLIPGSDVGMLPIVKVSAFHGTPLDGIGARPVLPMGSNEFILLIKGNSKTSTGSDTVVELQAKMKLNALVMKFELTMLNGPLNLATPVLSTISDYREIPALINKKFASYAGSCIEDTMVAFCNSGNTPVHVEMYSATIQDKASSDQMMIVKVSDTLVAGGLTANLTINNGGKLFRQATIFVISGENTITDPASNYQSDDGKCYLNIDAGSASLQTVKIGEAYENFRKAHSTIDCIKLFAHFSDSMLFYLQECPDAPSYSYALYSLNTNPATFLYSRSGSSPDQLTEITGDATYSGMFDIIIPKVTDKAAFSTNPDLGIGVNAGINYENWPNDQGGKK